LKEEISFSQPAEQVNEKLKNILHNPDFKNQLLANLEYLEPESARELARVLLWSDSVFSFGLVGQLPRSINFIVAFLDELGRQLQNVPPELIKAFTSEMVRKIDREQLQTLPHTLGPLFATFGSAKERQETMVNFLRKKLNSTDFGKLRKAITGRADDIYPLAEALAEAVISDPVAFANLLYIFPPLLNNCFRLTAKSLAKIDFPPEILASAVFNFIDDLETEELGSIITSLSHLINGLHQGSAVLGGNQPRFQAILERLTTKILKGLDQEETAEAIIALGEDLEVLFTVAAETAAAKPEFFRELSAALLKSSSAGFRGFSRLLEQAGLQEMLGRELHQWILSLPENSMPRLLKPEDLIGIVNALIASYNRQAAVNQKQSDRLIAFYLAHLDQDELSRALLKSSGQLSFALAENPVLSRSLLKACFKVILGIIKGALRRKPQATGRGK
jgi:hypothetical protein